VNEVIQLPQKKNITVFYEILDSQSAAIWGGEDPQEALNWYRRSPIGSRVLVSKYRQEDDEMSGFIDITPILIATIADSMARWC
jgi:hypothetical protein